MTFTAEQIARVAHEANRVLQDLAGDEAPSVPWECETEDTRASAVAGAEAALAGATPEELHEAWCRYKTGEGWIYGPAKDPEARVHPCLVPYDQLPPEQQVKDAVFAGIVRAMSGGTDPEDETPGYWQARTALAIALNALQRVALGSDDALAAVAKAALADAAAALEDAVGNVTVHGLAGSVIPAGSTAVMHLPDGAVYPPWSPEQVANLNACQRAGIMHPFTCGNDDCPGIRGMHASLVAQEAGWRCPACDYTQQWAHRFMAVHPLLAPEPEPAPAATVKRGDGWPDRGAAENAL